MATSNFVSGEYRTMPHTPTGGAITAGDFVTIGSVTANTAGVGALLAIAHHDIANNALGSLDIGFGVHNAEIASNYAAGVVLYKPSGNNILTTTSTNNAQAGILLRAASAANDVREFLHLPAPLVQ